MARGVPNEHATPSGDRPLWDGAAGGPIGEARRPDDRPGFAGRVLIVEDDPALAENLSELVQMLGYQTLAVPSAEAALAEIDEEPVGFIVTDHRLPGMSGAALLLALRSLGNTVPAVLTTAWIADEAADTARRSGTTAVMSKPIDIEALLSVIRRALGPPPPPAQ